METEMPVPNDAPSLPPGTTLSRVTGAYAPSLGLSQLLVRARSNYDWPAGTGAAASQQLIIDLEALVAARVIALNPTNAHQIVVDVSSWAGNNANSHAQIVGASPAQQATMQGAIIDLVTATRTSFGINALWALPGISLVIASKIFRFCSPQIGAAVDRHASYFFNSLPIVGHGHSTNFLRQWVNRHHTRSRLAVYSGHGFSLNRDEYLDSYLPLLGCIATALNAAGAQYHCAATGLMQNWNAADVEMAAYYCWASNGAR